MNKTEIWGCGRPRLYLGSIVPPEHYFNEMPKLYIRVKYGKQEIWLDKEPSNTIQLNRLLSENMERVCEIIGCNPTPENLELIVKENMEVCDEGGLAGAIYRYNTELAGGNWFVYAITRGYA